MECSLRFGIEMIFINLLIVMRQLFLLIPMLLFFCPSQATVDFTSGMFNERNVIQDYHTLDENCVVFFLYLGKYNRTRWGDSVFIKSLV